MKEIKKENDFETKREKSNIFIVKNRIMYGALFKSEFAYHFPSLKSNQFPSDNTFVLLLAELIQQLTHINLCCTFLLVKFSFWCIIAILIGT